MQAGILFSLAMVMFFQFIRSNSILSQSFRIFLASSLVLVFLISESYGAGVSLLLDSGPAALGTRVNKRIKSLLELRQERVILQNLDYSCGAAALATVLRHGFGLDISEGDLISLIFVFNQTPKAGIKKYFKRQGFTLLDLKRAARAKGFPSVGYKGMELQDLTDILSGDRLPVLVPIRPLGYNHFVVLKGIHGSRVYMADPAFGNKSMKIHQFIDVWIDGIGFIIKPKPSLAQTERPLKVAKTIKGIRISNDEDLAAISAAGVPPGMSLAKTRPQISEDSELEEISAGGLVPGPETLISDSPSESILNFEPEGESVEYWRVQNLILDPLNPPTFSNIQPSFQNQDGRGILTIFNAPNFRANIQLGEPSGNFVDFSNSVVGAP